MYGAIATTRRPIWVPTSSPYALPRIRPAISAPATAKIPAVAATARSAGHDDASTWRATRCGSRPVPGERHGGDQPERRGADADHGRRDQVRVAEARHGADALPGGDREADEVDRLERERERRARAELEEPRSDPPQVCSRGSGRHLLASRAPPERCRHQRRREHCVERHSPRDRLRAVLVDAHQEEDEPGRASCDEGERRDDVVVQGRERAREQPRRELAETGDDHPRQRRRRRVDGGVGAESGQHLGDRPRRDHYHDQATARPRRRPAAAYDAVSDESRPASRARASGGSTVTRTAVAARASTMNTPYAAKNPSVSAVRPSLRAMTTPTTAARPVCTAIPSAVTAPVASDPSPAGVVRFRTEAKPTASGSRPNEHRHPDGRCLR